MAGNWLKGVAGFGRKVTGRVGQVAREAGALGRASPGAMLLAGLGTADMVSQLVGGAPDYLSNMAYRGSGQMFNDRLNMALQGDALARQRQAKVTALLRLRADNESRLAAMDPHLYNELSVGMRLPPGAVVLGGTQDRTLINEVTMAMANGSMGASGGAGF